MIIDCYASDRPQLCKCSAVCSNWAASARRHLFRKLIITSDLEAEAFLLLLESPIAAVTLVRHIHKLEFTSFLDLRTLPLTWKTALRVVERLNAYGAANSALSIQTLSLSRLIDVRVVNEMDNGLFSSITHLQLFVPFYDHDRLRRFLLYFPRITNLEVTIPLDLPIIALAPIEELHILSPDVLIQLQFLTLRLGLRSPLLKWFSTRKHNLEEFKLTLDSDIQTQHIEPLNQVLSSPLSSILRELRVRFYILPSHVTSDLFSDLPISHLEKLRVVTIEMMLRDGALCIASLQFASYLPSASLEELNLEIFIGYSVNINSIVSPAWRIISETRLTRKTFPKLKKVRIELTFFHDDTWAKGNSGIIVEKIRDSFEPGGIRDLLQFSVEYNA